MKKETNSVNKTARNSVIYLCGTIIMACIGFGNTMLLTRILPPKIYAMYGLFVNFSTAVSTLIAFGYDSAYSRFYYNNQFTKKRYFYECTKLPIAIFLIFAIVFLEPSQKLATYVFGENLPNVSLIIILAYVFFAVIYHFTQLTARMEEYALNYVVSNIISRTGFILILLVVYCVLRNVNFNHLILSFLIAGVFAVANNCIVFTKVKNSEKKENVTAVTNKKLFLYGFPLMLNSVFMLIVPIIEKTTIRQLAGWDILSVYTAASIFQTVVLFMTNTVLNIWNPLVFKHCDNEKVFKPILHKFGTLSAALSVLGLALCILFRRWAVLLLDANYYDVYIIAPAILFSACFGIVDIIYSVGIKIKQKTNYLIITPILQLFLSVILCVVLVPKYGLAGVGVSTLLSAVTSKLYNIIIAFRFYNSGENEWKSFALCGIGILASLISMKYVAIQNDIILSLILLFLTIVILGSDIFKLCKKEDIITKT